MADEIIVRDDATRGRILVREAVVANLGGAADTDGSLLRAQAILWVPGLEMTNGQTVYRVAYEPDFNAETEGLPSGWRILETYEWGDTWVDHGDVRVLLGILGEDGWLSTYARATTDGFTPIEVSGLDLVTVACGGSYGDDGQPSVWVGINIGDFTGGADPREPATWFWPHLVGAQEVRVPSDFSGTLLNAGPYLLTVLRAIDAFTLGGAGGITQEELDAAVADLETLIDGKLDATAGLGGVLSGNAPNPGFAVNMATQAELDDEAAARQTDDATTLSAAEDYVDAAVSTLLGGAPAAALDTIAELAAAMEDEQDATTALTASIAAKLDASSPKLAPDPTLLPDDDFLLTASGLYVARTPAQVRTALNVANGATANSSDATLLARGNHTGQQALSTISDAGTAASKATGTSTGQVPLAEDVVLKALYDAGTFLYATSDNTPVPKTLAEARDLLDANDRTPKNFVFASYQTSSGTITPPGAQMYTLIALSSYVEWTNMTFAAGTWRFTLNLNTTNGAGSSTIQLAVGGADLGAALSTYEASGTPRIYTVSADKVFSTRTTAAIRWTTNNQGAARCVSWTAWRVD